MTIKIIGSIRAINNRNACLLRGVDEHISYKDREEMLEAPDKINQGNVNLVLEAIRFEKINDSEIVILAIYQ